MFSIEAYLVFFGLFIVAACLIASVRILREYERAVVFTLGALRKSRARASSS